jgi:DNA-binding response OmpR family regulator
MHNAKILVVDDDPDILAILRDNLELDGYPVVTAESGKDALALVSKEKPDLIILDILLPDMDGIQVCRVIRKGSRVPIVMLTAKDGVTDKVLGLDSGADDYVVKPFDYLELAARVNACLRREGQVYPREEAMVFGALTIDPGTRSVVMGARRIPLTRKEFDLLALLARHEGRVLDRARIKKAVWPEAKLYEWSRTIDMHVRNLRTKIEESPENPRCILTVSGVGYLFHAPRES